MQKPLQINFFILINLCILTINNSNTVYKNEQNIYWQVGLYTFVTITA
jgi:hypothetical protein